MLGLCRCAGCSPVAGCWLLVALASLVAEHRLSGTRASAASHVGSVAMAPGPWSPGAQQLWHRGLVAPQHPGDPEDLGSSRIRDRTCVSCTGSWIPYHWPTREALLAIRLMRPYRRPVHGKTSKFCWGIKKLLFLLKCNWFTILYQFQVPSKVIQYFYRL